jgi:trimeric autotransporter adhesin
LGAQVNVAADQTATWSITPNVGTMSGIGPNIATYTAPASITTQQQVTITATSVADPTKSAAATITLYPPVSISVSPTNAMLRASQTQQFVATVANAMDTGVTWSVVPGGVGTITATGLYTAPSSISADQVISVKATSAQDPSKVSSVNVSLKKSR